MLGDKRKRSRKQPSRGRGGSSPAGSRDATLDVAAQGGLSVAVRAVAAVGRVVGHGAKAAVEALT
ncbi:hypothetical protein GCM10020221_33500 [Streptomyces thioluteus]|uniref:Uncharacterized protein n=1 Tax=Streptomyces thioluteus TaxID=66431 RepID=A0ABP6JJ14_STRTU